MAIGSAAASPQTATCTRPLEYAWVEGVGEGCDCRVAAFCGERVLGQVVGSDADEVEVGEEGRDFQRGGRDLDHHADAQSVGQAFRSGGLGE
jgi:hypothetical protein